jgi:hypothetical protein
VRLKSLMKITSPLELWALPKVDAAERPIA